MSTTYSNDRPNTCQHVEIRMGCLACRVEDTQADLREANSQKSKCIEAVKGYKAYLQQLSELPEDQKLHFDQRLAKETELSAAWDKRSKVLEDVSRNFAKEVKAMCVSSDHTNGSTKLAKEFEDDAVERAFSMELIWKSSASYEHEEALVKFVPEDPACNVSFTGIDRSNIQAGPDWIVDNGLGFSVFLKSTKATRQPSQGLGPQPGPAIMSYGRAISEFGLPDPPESGPSNEASAALSEQLPAASEDEIIATQLSQCHLGTKKANTEGELRLARGDSPPTASKFSEQDQWENFGARRTMSFAGVVVRHYAKLVAQRVAEDKQQKQKQKQKGQTQEENSAAATADASTDPAPTDPAPTPFAIDKETGLPAVEGHDYNGLTNWICRCLVNHKGFLRVIKEWDKERDVRNERVAAKIAAWTPPTTHFEDGRLGQPNPRDFYNGTPLGQVDQAKLGIKTKVTTG